MWILYAFSRTERTMSLSHIYILVSEGKHSIKVNTVKRQIHRTLKVLFSSIFSSWWDWTMGRSSTDILMKGLQVNFKNPLKEAIVNVKKLARGKDCVVSKARLQGYFVHWNFNYIGMTTELRGLHKIISSQEPRQHYHQKHWDKV